MTKRTCDVPECGKPHKGRGLCSLHLQRQRAGKPLDAPPRNSWKGKTCQAEACDKPITALGLCSMHWQRSRSGAPMEAPAKVRNAGQACAFEDCTTPSRKRGWCSKHYERWAKHGDPSIVATIGKITAPCSVEGCERPYYAFGMCHLHRRRLLSGTVIDKGLRPRKADECSEEDCGEPGRYRGLCRKHRQRQDYAENPIPFKAKTARRRFQAARGMTELDKELSTAYREAIANDPCAYCGGRTDQMHVDHQFPLSKGGTDHWWNLATACSHCNLRKHAWCGTRFTLLAGQR